MTNNTLLNCAFVAKFSSVGSGTPSLIYGTYLGHTVGGSYGDLMTGIAADAAGDVYITGFTNQATFPTTSGAYQTTCDQYGVNGNTDASAARHSSPNSTRAARRCWRAPISGVITPARTIPPITSLRWVRSFWMPRAMCISRAPLRTGCRKSTRWERTMVRGARSRPSSRSSIELDDADCSRRCSAPAANPSSRPTVWRSRHRGQYLRRRQRQFAAELGGHLGSFPSRVRRRQLRCLRGQDRGAHTDHDHFERGAESCDCRHAINLTATVAEVGGASVPTGTVTFKDGTTTLGSMTLNGTGIAVYTTSSLSVGTHSITAAYGGDAANGASSSTAASVTVTAAPAPTVTISVAPTSIVLGQSATLTWSSTNATACTASNAWTGTEALSGTLSVTPSAGGSSSYTLTCTGAAAAATVRRCSLSPILRPPSRSQWHRLQSPSARAPR